MNPLLPPNHLIPDVEARPMPNGRLYLYGSCDVSGDSDYGSSEMHVFSTDDMLSFTHHGVAFRSADVPWGAEQRLYAPDCIHRDGKYYLYFCMANGIEGVAVAEKPEGPFTDAQPMLPADGDSIDPAVFVDDDGQAYYFWGQFQLRGAKLNGDMRTLDSTSLQTHILDEKQHGFHEGASIRKRSGLYYMVYTDIARGRPTCMSYATAAAPLGPYTKQGVIVDNTGCDPQTWNNHGSIAEYKGQWYVFYHRSSQNTTFNRRVCAEPISFDENGRIIEVEMTSQGPLPPLDCRSRRPAAAACRMMGAVNIYPEKEGGEVLGYFRNGNWAVWKYLEFDAPARLELEASAGTNGGCEVEVWAGRQQIGCCKVPSTGDTQNWQTFTCPVEQISGVLPLYLVCRGAPLGRLLELRSFKFV